MVVAEREGRRVAVLFLVLVVELVALVLLRVVEPGLVDGFRLGLPLLVTSERELPLALVFLGLVRGDLSVPLLREP